MRFTSRSGRNAARAVALTLAFGLSAVFSVAMTREANGIASLWLATGFLAAALLILDRAWGVATAAACYGLNVAICVVVGDGWLPSLLFSGLRLGEAALTAWLARWACGPGVRLTSLTRVVRLMLMAIAPATALTSLAAANLWTVFGRSFDSVLATYFFANTLGMALVLPAVLLLRQRQRGFERSVWEKLAIYLMLAVLTLLVTHFTRFPLHFLLFPATILAAFRLGGRGAAVGCLVIAGMGLTGVMLHPGSGVNPDWTLAERIRMLQFLISLVFLSSLATAMALVGQERLRRLWIGRSRVARLAEARAYAASQAKAEFLATMSHEIRTPMNSIVGFAQVLLKRDDLPDAARRQLELIGRAGASLTTSVNDILYFSRMEAGEIELALKPSSPRAVAQDALAIVNEAARAKNLALDMTVAGGADELVMIDDLRVRQILLNLLSNAIKFTEAGRVRLDVQPGDGKLRFTVTDTGIGIPEEKLGRLFQRFSQLDCSTTRAFSGTGLGLAIARALVEAMGGQIGVEQAAVTGSVFWFEIPAPAAEKPEAADSRAPALGARVLLVDDHETNRELGITVLRLLGCAVDTASNGQDAVAAARTGVYDIILMDIHMPRMDGLEAALAIRALGGEIARTPIVAMSADATPETTERCLKAGMVDALEKPIQIAALHAMIAKWMGRYADAA